VDTPSSSGRGGNASSFLNLFVFLLIHYLCNCFCNEHASIFVSQNSKHMFFFPRGCGILEVSDDADFDSRMEMSYAGDPYFKNTHIAG
jgi:hypothetical protein